jgi:hypothetical protein
VRNGVKVTRVFLQETIDDSTRRPTVQETDIPRPAQPLVANSAYSIWSLNLTQGNVPYTIGAEVDGVMFSSNDEHSLVDFAPC